jgi:hypothetical protein
MNGLVEAERRIQQTLATGDINLDLSRLKLKTVPELTGLPILSLAIDHNKLTQIPPLPESLLFLRLAKNPFEAPFDRLAKDYTKGKLTIQALRGAIPEAIDEANRLRYEQTQKEARKIGRNLLAFEQTLPRVGPGFATPANWYEGPQVSSLYKSMDPNLTGVIGSYLSGKTGSLRNQILQAKEKASRGYTMEGVGGRRKTSKRKGVKAKTRKSVKKRTQ